MGKSFYTKVTGNEITGPRWVLVCLRVTQFVGWQAGSRFLYSHFTVEGKRWKQMVLLSQEAEQVIREIVQRNDTLRRLERQVHASVASPVDQRTWWALFEIFEEHQVANMVQDFLSQDNPRHLQSFAQTCTRLTDQIQQVSAVSETEGVVLKERAYIKTIAVQQLATCFAEFAQPGRTEEQIRRHIRTY